MSEKVVLTSETKITSDVDWCDNGIRAWAFFPGLIVVRQDGVTTIQRDNSNPIPFLSYYHVTLLDMSTNELTVLLKKDEITTLDAKKSYLLTIYTQKPGPGSDYINATWGVIFEAIK
jgi:hypothetical protein